MLFETPVSAEGRPRAFSLDVLNVCGSWAMAAG